MNSGIFGEGFPYSNFHDLNMDWIIKIAKDFLDQYTNIQQTISDGLDDLQDKYNELDALLQEWYNTHSEDIADALAEALAELNSWYTEHSQDIADELASALEDFNTNATERALEVLESIPLDYSALSETVQELNCDNFLNQCSKNDAASLGITYEWDGSFCRVSGTSTALSFNNIYNNVSALPAGLQPGDKFYAGCLHATNCGLEIYKVDANQDVQQLFFSVNEYPTDYIEIPNDAVGMIVRIRVNANTTLNETVYPFLSLTPPQFILNSRTFKNWANGDCVFLKPTQLNQARQTEINNLLTQYKNVVLLAGTFYISGSIIIPEGCTLSGVGTATRILANGTNVVSVTLNNNSSIKNLWLDGGGTDRPTDLGTRYGIYVNEIPQCVWIENCKISGFNRFGIYMGAKGTGTYPQFINNCYVELCYYGICVFNGDYIEITNTTVRNNYCGIFENGGVTKYTACGMDSNSYGILMNPTYENNGHGAFTNCSICHNSVSGIELENITNGEIFSNCQIHFNPIAIKGTSKGIQFIGCQIGNNVAILFTSSKKNFINHCLFWVTPTITDTGTGTLVLHECYNIQTGEQITH